VEGIKRSGLRVSLEASFAEHDLRGSHYITWIIRDITFRTRIEEERKALEQQLQAAQRMDSIGQLTGGIAHDFNNLLVAINGYAELGLASTEGEATLKQYMEEILQAGERAADMTNKLLAFSRRQIIEPKPLQINQLIYGIEKIIHRLLPEHISTRFVPDPTDPTIVADPGQIEQVVVNLAVNARDAMPHGGQLLISIARTSLEKGDIKRSYQRPGNFVIIRVEDTGSGMSGDIRKRLFEPFFTTKPEGAGTGLGMAVVFGIVKQHDGFIDVESKPEAGSKIEIYLPLAGAHDFEHNPLENSSASSGGHETILLVEDNPHVRDLARLILSDAGYLVIEANDGVDAIDVFKASADTIDLVIMDVVMPRLGGKQVMKQMKQIDPDARILFTSGYSSGGIHTNFILEQGLDFIPKPYGAGKLRERVRSILDECADT
jgi:signal transduction histidine kinase/CheY-like chemotaxis protein